MRGLHNYIMANLLICSGCVACRQCHGRTRGFAPTGLSGGAGETRQGHNPHRQKGSKRLTERDKKTPLIFLLEGAIMNDTQGSYIGSTAASQAAEAGSTPVPCSTKKVTFVYRQR